MRGLRGDGRDERFRQIDLAATAITGVVLITVVIGAFLVEVARGHDGSTASPFSSAFWSGVSVTSMNTRSQLTSFVVGRSERRTNAVSSPRPQLSTSGLPSAASACSVSLPSPP